MTGQRRQLRDVPGLPSPRIFVVLALPLVVLLVLPLIALATSQSPAEVLAGVRDPMFAPALWLSLKTSLLSLGLIVVGGTPLSWWLSQQSDARRRVLALLTDIPIVLPPAVVGIALLMAFGRNGLLGGLALRMGVSIPFTTSAVVLAQIIIAAPFYVQSATLAFSRINSDMLLMVRTLGLSPLQTALRVGVPLALPGLLGGAALSWARALGEFGATLLFAGNWPGVTQTMPLAIYAALESDTRVAVALALVLSVIAICALLALRFFPAMLRRRHGGEA